MARLQIGLEQTNYKQQLLVCGCLLSLRKGWCLIHGQECQMKTACVHVAGTSCTDFSAIGKGDAEHGMTYSHLLIWASHRKQLQEPVIVQENVCNFPRETLLELLPEYEWCFGIVEPNMYGWPIRRARQWAVRRAYQQSIMW